MENTPKVSFFPDRNIDTVSHEKKTTDHNFVCDIFSNELFKYRTGGFWETLEFMIDMAKITGSLDGMRWDFSTDGAKGPWCFGMADSYIQNVMGFNGSNGTDRMGKVSNAYFRACMDG